MIILGGLGGGGDVGLALILAEHSQLWNRLGAVVSFARCKPLRRWVFGERVSRALIRVAQGSVPSRRFFEDKIGDIVGDVPVYIVCREADVEGIAEGLLWAVREHGVDCTLHTDLGGNSLVLGYEDRLGSYTTDTLARAALYLVSRRTGLRSIVAAGLLGGEGGGGELSLLWLAATLALLRERGAILDLESPGPESAWPARLLLSRAESGMPPTSRRSRAGGRPT